MADNSTFQREPFTKEDVIHYLHEIENGCTVNDEAYFNYCCDQIESAFDYLMARLKESECARFE